MPDSVFADVGLPQPQVLVNAWMMQSSVANPKYSGRITNLLHQAVNSYNDVIQTSLGLGWQQLRLDSKIPFFFDRAFYDYVKGPSSASR